MITGPNISTRTIELGDDNLGECYCSPIGNNIIAGRNTNLACARVQLAGRTTCWQTGHGKALCVRCTASSGVKYEVLKVR
jgi:hypothetical protein